jgi:hypothetical protein
MLRPLSFIKKLSVFLLVYFNCNLGHAQVYNSSVSAATGGTGRAAVQAGDALLLNAATLVHLRGRHFYSSFAKEDMVLSLSDNTQDSVIPAGFAYLQENKEINRDKYSQNDFSLSLADFVVNRFAVGLTGHYIEVKSPDAEGIRYGNADLGMSFTPNGKWGFGLAVYNLLKDHQDVPEIFKRKTTAGLGMNYIYERLARFRLDVTSESQIMAGLESYMNQWFILRFGYQNDSKEDRQLLGAGFGFDGPRFGVNYAYLANTKESSDYRHSVDLQIPF